MKVQHKEGRTERQILRGLITESSLLAAVEPTFERDMFNSRWSNLIAQWCITYYRKYAEPIGSDIQTWYDSWFRNTKDESTSKLIEEFLLWLSREEDQETQPNSEYLIDVANWHFRSVKLSKLANDVKVLVDQGKPDKAEEKLNEHSKSNVGRRHGEEVLNLQAMTESVDMSREKPLIRYPDPVNKFLQGIMGREQFVTFVGPEKRGKSYWLLDVAWRAMLSRQRVLYFQIGDLTRKQIFRRFTERLCRRPMRYPKTVAKPKSLEVQDGEVEVDFDHKTFEGPITPKEIKRELEQFQRMRLKSTRSFLKIEHHPSKTINAREIRSKIIGYEQKGWVPDVVVIDYADVLGPMDEFQQDPRWQINETWMTLDQIRQEYHCLLVTATQADAAAYDAKRLGMKNFSENKQKWAWVTGAIGINQTDEERKQQIVRLNWVVPFREAETDTTRCCYVAECRDIANVCVRSYF